MQHTGIKVALYYKSGWLAVLFEFVIVMHCYSHVQCREESAAWESKTPTSTASVSFQQWKCVQ